QMLRGILKSAKFNVSTAADGQATLRTLRKKKIDLLLLDIWMPKMSGLDVLARLEEQTSRPKVVVMTSDQTPETMLRAMRGRVYPFFPNPLEQHSWLELTRNALSPEPAVPPIEVLSAKPHWVELLVPCDRSVVNRVRSFMQRLEADLPAELRDR